MIILMEIGVQQIVEGRRNWGRAIQEKKNLPLNCNQHRNL